jgi:hypothetical protein
MEVVTALVVLAAQHGTSALVQAIGGDSASSSLAGEIVKAIADSESRIGERLSVIETKIDALREQPFAIAFGRGTRHLLHAMRANDRARIMDLEDPYRALVEAVAAAPGPLHEAVAQRYLLLSLIALGRGSLLAENVVRLETLALVAGFDAAARASSTDHPSTILSRRGQLAQRAHKSALEGITMSGRLLDEAGLFAKYLGLPSRDSVMQASSSHDGNGGYWVFSWPLAKVGPLLIGLKDLGDSKRASHSC